MIIDTDRLREKIESADDGFDWETCSISLLNYAEARALKRISIIEAVEVLSSELSS